MPQVGWNQISQRSSHPLFSGIADQAFFYFVHSYYCESDDPEVVVGETEYGATVRFGGGARECLWRAVSSGEEPDGGAAVVVKFCETVEAARYQFPFIISHWHFSFVAALSSTGVPVTRLATQGRQMTK